MSDDDGKQLRAQALGIATQEGRVILGDDTELTDLTVERNRPSTNDDWVDLGY